MLILLIKYCLVSNNFVHSRNNHLNSSIIILILTVMGKFNEFFFRNSVKIEKFLSRVASTL